MPYRRLLPLTDEINDSLEASITHLRRFAILCDKAAIPAELLREFGEFSIDWGTNIEKLGNLYIEHLELVKLLAEDLHEDTEEKLKELRE